MRQQRSRSDRRIDVSSASGGPIASKSQKMQPGVSWTWTLLSGYLQGGMPERDPSRNSDGVGEHRSSAGCWLVLGLVLASVRFYRLGDWSLWIDEAYTLADAYHTVGNYNRPGYWIIQAVVEAMGAPATEFSLRMGPALAGWLCVPLTWWALRPVLGSVRASQAALLMAISPWQLYWSQNARFYTFVELSALLGAGIYFRGILSLRLSTVSCGLLLVALGCAFHLQAALVCLGLSLAPCLASLAEAPTSSAPSLRGSCRAFQFKLCRRSCRI